MKKLSLSFFRICNSVVSNHRTKSYFSSCIDMSTRGCFTEFLKSGDFVGGSAVAMCKDLFQQNRGLHESKRTWVFTDAHHTAMVPTNANHRYLKARSSLFARPGQRHKKWQLTRRFEVLHSLHQSLTSYKPSRDNASCQYPLKTVPIPETCKAEVLAQCTGGRTGNGRGMSSRQYSRVSRV